MKLFMLAATTATAAAASLEAYRIRADGVCVEATFDAVSDLDLIPTEFRAGSCLTAGFTRTVGAGDRSFSLPESFEEADYDQLFAHFSELHSKSYADEAAESAARVTLSVNLDEILATNRAYIAGKSSFWTGLTPFADLSNDEFRKQMLRPLNKRRGNSALATFNPENVHDVPDAWDWRKDSNKTVVTPIKNQGSCGSCWAFSAVATMEGRYAFDSGDLQDFSEQEVVDCTMKGAYTCALGGEMHDGIEEIATNHAGKINTEDQYPYQGTSGRGCRAKESEAIDAQITGYANVTVGDEDALKAAAYARPIISVGIDASSIAFQLYLGGVYDPLFCSSTNLDHGVSVVGYGTSSTDKDYWWVKNSWGKAWGESGYVEMIRNKKNHCGIATDACYALSKSAPASME